jgi:hypothetical protein
MVSPIFTAIRPATNRVCRDGIPSRRHGDVPYLGSLTQRYAKRHHVVGRQAFRCPQQRGQHSRMPLYRPWIFLITDGGPTDSAVIGDITSRARWSIRKKDWSPSSTATLSSIVDTVRNHACFVVEHNGTIIGSAGITPLPGGLFYSDSPWLIDKWFYIMPSYRPSNLEARHQAVHGPRYRRNLLRRDRPL